MSTDAHSFSPVKIFVILFVLTMIEVAWSFFPFPRWALWGGLLLMAYMKGHLIFTYFMHMKFEGWIVKGLIAPTVPLVAIVIFALMPDVSHNTRLEYPVGSQLDRKGERPGEVVDLLHFDPPEAEENAAAGGH